ncbi:MAG: C45 family autoproteolytic acyltransferase/hydrolase [Pirellula sp.]|nr:C45 family autoproteolytic acyltransferase/hydrolase [Pirellula sp.]
MKGSLRFWFFATMGSSFLLLAAPLIAFGQESKPQALQRAETAATKPFATPEAIGGSGHRMTVGEGDSAFPLIVVRGTPYEMGYHLGRQFSKEMHQFVPAALAGILSELHTDEPTLLEVWSRSVAYGDDRVEQELAGLADGSGLPLRTLQAMHAIPLLMPYSCSSIAAWGEATVDGHLYQTRNLDWSMKVGAHEFPMIVLYLPADGTPHIVPSFAGMIGAHTGMNANGIALSEMGDASAKEAPYAIHAPHFTVLFRSMLYDADSLTKALSIFESHAHTKRYHYVFGDGKKELRAVKVRAHTPEPIDQRIKIWKDNDPSDEFAPNVLSCVVYNDEGRGAFPTLKKERGKLDGEKMIALANSIPIKGGNVENVVYDATDLRLWVSYAKGSQEAYQRPYTFIDLKKIDADKDGKPDLHSSQP